MMDGKIHGLLYDIDMWNGHDGLAKLIKQKLKMNVDELEPGQFVLCINKSWTALKAYGANHIILHHKVPDGKRLNPKAVMRLPRFIRGQQINYDKALTEQVHAEYLQRYGELPPQN